MKILDEVVQLHKSFNSSWRWVQSFYQSEIDPSYCKVSDGTFIASSNDNNTITIYFVVDGCVLRHGSVKMDLAFLFPITNQETGEVVAEGLSMNRIKSICWDTAIFKFSLKPLDKTYDVLYSLRVISRDSSNVKDDRGIVWTDTQDIPCLSSCKLPKEFQVEYDLVGTYYHARYTTESDIHCVLIAELSNPMDECAIRVLRWDPQPRAKNELASIGNVFFSLGYIDRSQNALLHAYMVKHNCRVLFATKHNAKLHILGGIEVLKENNICYPNCLINIPIHE